MRRRIVWGLVALTGIVTVTFAGVVAWLQSDSGRAVLAARLGALLSSPGQQIQIGRIEGSVPFDLRINTISAADRLGVFARIDTLEIRIAPANLLTGRLVITKLAAGSIAFIRPPETAPSESSGNGDLALPGLPVSVELQELAFPKIDLGAPVLGDALSLSIAGKAELLGRTADITLALRRLDQDGHADIKLTVDGNPATLHLDADIGEPSGLAANQLLGRSDRLPLSLSLKGEGPLTDWHGTLSAKAGMAGAIDASVGLGVHDGWQMALAGTASIVALLPVAYQPLAGPVTHFDLGVTQGNDRALVLDHLVLDAGLRADAIGRLNQKTKALDATLHVAVGDLSNLTPLIGAASGTLDATAHLTGTLDRLEAAVTVSGAPVVAGIGASALTTTIDLKPTGDLSDPQTRLAIDGTGHVEGLTVDAKPLAADLGAALDFHAALETGLDFKAIDISALSVTAPDLSVTGSGHVEDGRVAAKAQISASDLSRFRAIAGLALAGKADFSVDLAPGRNGAITGSVTGQGRDLVTGVAALDALLGKRFDLSASVEQGIGGGWSFDQVKLAGTSVTLTGTASLPPGDTVTAALKLAVPELKSLGPALHTQVSGVLTVTATMAGKRAAPDIKAKLDGSRLVLGGQRLDSLAADITGKTGSQPSAQIAARFAAGTLNGTLDASGQIKGGKVLSLSKLALQAAGTRIDGAFDVALDSSLISGALTAKSPDLAPWSTLAGVALAGQADLKATLSKARDGQSADITATGRGVTAAGVRIAKASLTARISDLLRKPAGQATLELGRTSLSGGSIDAAKLDLVSSKPGAFGLKAAANGKFVRPFRLALAGDAALDGANERLTIASLTGQLAGQDIALKQPLTLSRQGSDIAIKPLSLAFGSGSIDGAVSLAKQRIEATLSIDRLPLKPLATLAGHPKIGGTATLNLTASGAASNPSAQMSATISQLVLDDDATEDMRIDATASATLAERQLTWRAEAGLPGQEKVTASGVLPVQIDAASLTASVDPDAPFSLQADGTADLAKLGPLLPLGEDHVAGQLVVAARLRGTLDRPDAEGTLTLDKGSYTNQAIGTEIRALTVRLVGTEDRVTVDTLTGTDGEKGKLEGSGSIELGQDEAPVLKLDMRLSDFRAARGDTAGAGVDAGLHVTGSMIAPQLTGTIAIKRADIAIPDQLPPSVPTLNVVVIDSKHGGKVIFDEKPPPPVVLGLDLAIAVPGQTFVRGRGLDSEWKGDLKVSGTSAAPRIDGQLQVVRGTFALLGQNFSLDRGVIDFAGGDRIDPQLDIQASSSAADVTAQIAITGSPTAPTLKLTSTPALPQDEILSRLLFGRNASQISALQGLQLAQAAASMTGGGGTGFIDRLRRMSGLDRLNFGSSDTTGQTSTSGTQNSSNSTTNSGPTVSGGKYVAEGVFVGVEQGTASNSSRAKVEIELTPNLSVESGLGADSSSSVGATWRYDY